MKENFYMLCVLLWILEAFGIVGNMELGVPTSPYIYISFGILSVIVLTPVIIFEIANYMDSRHD